MKKQLFKLFFAFIILIFVLSACGRPPGYGGKDSKIEDRKYFEGTEGVEMSWIDYDSPPPKLYYYSDTNDNTFDITAEVANVGSSFTRGGLFLSGYDPTFIHVLGITPDLSNFGTCGISLGNIGFGDYGFEIACDQGRFRVGERGVSVNVNDILGTLGAILGRTGWDRIPLLGGADFSFDETDENQRIKVHLGPGVSIDLEYGSRGKLLIALFAGIDFTRNFGIEYLLAGDTPEFPGGDIAVIDWDANIISFPPGVDEVKQTFLVTNCYLYTTHAAPVICIDPAPFSEGKKVCRPGTYASKKGQGAPLELSEVTQENSPRFAVFTLKVQNKGKGEIWDPGAIEKCSPYQGTRVTSSDKNKVWLGQIRVSGDPAWLDCIPDDFIRLDRDTRSGMITCKYDIPFQGLKSAYQTPLIAEFWYGVEETMQKDVVIKRVT